MLPYYLSVITFRERLQKNTDELTAVPPSTLKLRKAYDSELYRFFRESVECPDLNIIKFIRAFFYPIVGIGVNFPLNALLILKKK